MTTEESLHDLRAENARLKRQLNKFGLTFKRYPEQGDAQRLLNGEIPYLTFKPEYSTIKEDRTEKDTPHALIEGDNLSALLALQNTHKGKVDVVYIDPPYNTGNNDFVYNDRYVSNDDGFRHSKWLSFMEPRLELAKELLSDTGVIFVSIDDNEQAALKMLMDKVFGTINYISTISVVNNLKGRSDDKYFATAHESLLCFSKKASEVEIKGLSLSNEQINEYKFSDDKGFFKPVGLKKTGKNALRSDRPNMFYPIYISLDLKSFSLIKQEGWHEVYPMINGQEGCWRWGKETFEKNYKTEIIANVTRKNEITINVKMRLESEDGQRTSRPKTIWLDSRYDTGAGGRTISAVLGSKNIFSSPKPLEFIKTILQISSSINSIILDFFAGSGTTGHAVAALNAEDGGNRHCILVTNNFEQDGSPNGIARDVTAARMKAVLTGKWADGKERNSLPGELYYYKVEFQNESKDKNIDLAGVINVKENAYSSVGVETKHDALQVFSVHNEDKWIAIWNNASLFDLGDDEVEEAIISVNKKAVEENKKLVWYVAVDDNSEIPYIPDEDLFTDGNPDAQVIPYPFSYIRNISSTVKRLESDEKLVKIEDVSIDDVSIDDAEGEEGIPLVLSDINN